MLATAKAHAQGARVLKEEAHPVAAILAHLERRLRALEPGRWVSTEIWFEELPGPEARVTLLLALLELARLQKVLLGQKEGFGAVLPSYCVTRQVFARPKGSRFQMTVL